VVLAEAGLLDGCSATTYWARAHEFVRRYPAVRLRPDVLFVEDRNVVTSAGLGAGIDMCLHLVRTDYGARTANAVGRLVVAAPVRSADHPQLVTSPVPPETGTSLAATRAWALQRLHEPLTRAALAAHARTSIRTLTRRFHAETGLSPLCHGDDESDLLVELRGLTIMGRARTLTVSVPAATVTAWLCAPGTS
jgi:transcriptional regulator GlxA family with amidase domain